MAEQMGWVRGSVKQEAFAAKQTISLEIQTRAQASRPHTSAEEY
jgi:hypothetical protein